jgi:predicted enzyme related to lactoylglutathione lyase
MSETSAEPATKIVWFEVPAGDTGRARSFYGDLFGWQFSPMEGPMEYHTSSEAGGAIYPGEGNRGMIVYFGVADIKSALGRVAELGGEAGEAQTIPGIGSYAVCADSEGNAFGLFEAP